MEKVWSNENKMSTMGTNQNIDIKRASAYYLVATMFNKGMSFFTVPIFTRILSIEDYGIVTTYNSWFSILCVVASLALYMGIRSSFVDYKDKNLDYLAVIVTFTICYGLIMLVSVIGISLIVSSELSGFLITFCVLQSIGDAILQDISMYLMMRYKYRLRTAILVLPNFLSTVISVVLIKFFIKSNQYLGRIIPNAVIISLFALVGAIEVYRRSKERFNNSYIKYGLKISLPLIFHGIALGLLSQSDRTMITAYRGPRETAIYGLIYNLSMIATVITTAFDGVWIPFFTNKLLLKDYRAINEFGKKYTKIMAWVVSSVVLISPEVVKILATEKYWEGISIIPPIVLANYFIFLYTLYVNIEHFHKRTVFISINTIIAAIVNIVLNLVFIPRLGYFGAAYTTLFSYIISLTLHYYYARKIDSKLFPIRDMIGSTLLVFSVIGMFYCFETNIVVRAFIITAISIYIGVSERKWIRNILIMKTRN